MVTRLNPQRACKPNPINPLNRVAMLVLEWGAIAITTRYYDIMVIGALFMRRLDHPDSCGLGNRYSSSPMRDRD